MEGYGFQLPRPVGYCEEPSIHFPLVVFRQVFRDGKNT
jgi:hypothetical protein